MRDPVRFVVGFLLASPVAVNLLLAQALIGGDWRADIERFGRGLTEGGLTPGMSVAVADGDRVVFSHGFGLADSGSGRGVDDGTAFYIASATKSLTATATVLLAGRGKLDLRAPMTRYLPAARFGPSVDPRSVTIDSLLSMTEGLEDGGPIGFRASYSGEFTNKVLLDLLPGYGPAANGRTFEYDNVPYNLLGIVLEAVGGGGWKEVVAREVLTPLRMSATSASRSRFDLDRLALPHQTTPEGFQRVPLAKNDANLHAAGGHFATASDLARFLAAHITGGVVEGRRLFPRRSIELTHQKRADQDRDVGLFHRHGWGYGWDLGTYEGKALVSRSGSFSGYYSIISFMPDHQVGVVVLVNGDGPASRAADLMAAYVFDRVIGRSDCEETFAARRDALTAQAEQLREQTARHLAERRARLAPLPRPLADYAGTYENPRYGPMEWRVIAGGLEVRMGLAGCRAEVYEAATDRLRVELTGSGEVVDFEPAPEGGPVRRLIYAGEEFLRIGGGPPTSPARGAIRASAGPAKVSL